MLDWGIGLAVGVGAAVVSEVAILTAILLPKFPIEKGRTWRGTFYGVTTVSAIVGGIAGYIASQFGGFGGGGTNVPGERGVMASRAEQPIPKQATKTDTAPQKPNSYLASYVDLYFIRDEKSQLVKNFEGELALYRWRDKKWNPEFQHVSGQGLKEFVSSFSTFLEQDEKDIPPDERANRRLRVYLKPFPGEGVFDQIKAAAEQRGWKVDRKDATWQAEMPAS